MYGDGEKWVRLKSRVGPHHVTVRHHNERTLQDTVTHLDFSIDNSCIDTAPISWWEANQDNYLDRTNNLKYKEAFEVLGYGDSAYQVHVG